KFLDPIADKMLTTAAFLGFMVLGIGYGTVWITFIVLLREFIVASVRMVAVSSGGKVIAANIWGKLKTVAQMVAIIFAMAAEQFKELCNIAVVSATLDVLTNVLLWASAVLCVISGVIYLIDNKEFIDTTK
ncbi:MAG: CDP-diacylglycerol--glycerol-3-phosphate 3-phosphatidyltransferase, partial [Clostridia bacterium]|nr:CDP-diacylglycerol--glycerol-3-phosphate 3-phosphatidyltransferase [Clostridia bacterium]